MSILHNIDLGVDIGVHCQKRKSAIVWLVCVRGVFRAGALFYFIFTLLDFIFSCVHGTKTFFAFAQENSRVQPLAVMLSAAEAELGALYLNAREAVYSRQILTKMGHPQPQTLIQTDN